MCIFSSVRVDNRNARFVDSVNSKCAWLYISFGSSGEPVPRCLQCKCSLCNVWTSAFMCFGSGFARLTGFAAVGGLLGCVRSRALNISSLRKGTGPRDAVSLSSVRLRPLLLMNMESLPVDCSTHRRPLLGARAWGNKGARATSRHSSGGGGTLPYLAPWLELAIMALVWTKRKWLMN